MARQDDELLLDDELTQLFGDDEPVEEQVVSTTTVTTTTSSSDDDYVTVPGQLAVDVYETAEKLVVKARTAGVSKNDLDVSIADGVLTISGTLSSNDDSGATHWHIQECYWGEFSRTLVLPVAVKEDEVEATLKDGVLTVSFSKVKQEQVKKISIS
ncbi:Hsp20/alpha crystallin family protein [Candidatus Saccharibacteria bacterium]|nr:Hsp20/alpha crystallin family protein [Candidatus Saccharibacteria bacterium]MCL1963201.1 Hsp20/alpha crystallin family protein [Candidatus Saccharibacteria bacterium]